MDRYLQTRTAPLRAAEQGPLRRCRDFASGSGPLRRGGSHGSLTSILKKANAISPPAAASGSSYSMVRGSSSVRRLISPSARRTGLSVSARVSTTSTNAADRSGPTTNLDSTPPDTVSLLSTTGAASARKAPVITPPKLPPRRLSATVEGYGADRGGFGRAPPAPANSSSTTDAGPLTQAVSSVLRSRLHHFARSTCYFTSRRARA